MGAGRGRKEKGGFAGGQESEEHRVQDAVGVRSPLGRHSSTKSHHCGRSQLVADGAGLGGSQGAPALWVGLTVSPPHCGDLKEQSAGCLVTPRGLVQLGQRENSGGLAHPAETWCGTCRIASEVTSRLASVLWPTYRPVNKLALGNTLSPAAIASGGGGSGGQTRRKFTARGFLLLLKPALVSMPTVCAGVLPIPL